MHANKQTNERTNIDTSHLLLRWWLQGGIIIIIISRLGYEESQHHGRCAGQVCRVHGESLTARDDDGGVGERGHGIVEVCRGGRQRHNIVYRQQHWVETQKKKKTWK